MSVDQEEILPAIIVEVDKSIAPAHVALGAPGNARGDRRIVKVHASVVAIEGGVLNVEMRKQQRHAPGVRIVAESNPHVGLFESVFVRRYTGSQGHVLEFSRAVAVVEIVRLAIVGHEEIELPVIVEIRPNGGQAITTLGIVDASLLRYIGKGSIAVIVVKIVGEPLQPSRAALHVESQVLARFARTEHGQIVQMKINVVRDKKIGPAIAVIVPKSRACRPSGIAGQAGGFGHVGKCAIAIVAIEDDAIQTRHQQIRPTVVVVIANGRPHRPTGIAHTCLIGDIRECSVVVVVKQRAASFDAMQSHVHALRVRKINVRPAIAVVVDQRDSPAHRLCNEFRLRTRQVFEMNSSGFRDVDQMRIVGERAGRLTLGLGLLTLRRRQRGRRSHLRDRLHTQANEEKC